MTQGRSHRGRLVTATSGAYGRAGYGQNGSRLRATWARGACPRRRTGEVAALNLDDPALLAIEPFGHRGFNLGRREG